MFQVRQGQAEVARLGLDLSGPSLGQADSDRVLVVADVLHCLVASKINVRIDELEQVLDLFAIHKVYRSRVEREFGTTSTVEPFMEVPDNAVFQRITPLCCRRNCTTTVEDLIDDWFKQIPYGNRWALGGNSHGSVTLRQVP